MNALTLQIKKDSFQSILKGEQDIEHRYVYPSNVTRYVYFEHDGKRYKRQEDIPNDTILGKQDILCRFLQILVVTIFICKNDKFSTLNLHRKTWRIFSSAIYKNQSVILYWYYIHILIIIW